MTRHTKNLSQLQELDIFVTQQATSSSQPSRSPLQACHNVIPAQHPAHPDHHPKPILTGPQHHQKLAQGQGPGFECDVPTQGQDSQADQPHPSFHAQQHGANQEGVAEQLPARSSVQLEDQHASHGNAPDLMKESSMHKLEGQEGMARQDQHLEQQQQQHQQQQQQHQQQQEQQQQQLVPWGVESHAGAGQVTGHATGQQALGSARGSILQTLQELHQQPPWADLTVRPV